jgi:hypothetical protein
MNQYLLYGIIIIFLIAVLMFIGSKKTVEAMTEQQFETDEQSYYKNRESGGLMAGMNDINKFPVYDASKPLGEQLVSPLLSSKPVVSTTDVDVDNAVQTCKNISSCDQLDGTPCGYCFYNNKYLYGDENGPLTDVCPGGWVKTAEECQKRRERAICKQVKNCKEMVGEASICAWCPTKNKAYAYKEQGGILVPKYSEDTCDDNDINGQALGLVKQSDCGSFSANHPCVGPNEATGPHSMKCLEHLWSMAGGTSKGTHAPQNNAAQAKWWNSRGWEATFDDMKAWVADAKSSNWNTSKSHYAGVYGVDPDPCSTQYSPRPLECAQKAFTDAGCSAKGKGYPTTENMNQYGSGYYGTQDWPKVIAGSVGGMKNFFKNLMKNTHSTDYNTKNNSMELCLGKQAAAPAVNITMSNCSGSKTLLGLGTDKWLYKWEEKQQKWVVIFKESYYKSFTFLGSTLFVLGDDGRLNYWDLNAHGSNKFRIIDTNSNIRLLDITAVGEMIYGLNTSGKLMILNNPLTGNSQWREYGNSIPMQHLGRVLEDLYGLDSSGKAYIYSHPTEQWERATEGCCIHSIADYNGTVYGLGNSKGLWKWTGNGWVGGQVPNSCCMIHIESVDTQTLQNFLTTNNSGNNGIGGGVTNTVQGATRNLVYVSNGKNSGRSYNISKSEVQVVMDQIKQIYPGALLASDGDVQQIVDYNIGFCACGWGIDGMTGGFTSFYPSNINSNSGCGRGKKELISCGSNGPSWAGGKAGLYVIINDLDVSIPTKLEYANVTGTVVAKYTDAGAIAVHGTSVNDENDSNPTANYIGCYKDSGSRAMPTHLGDNMTYDEAYNAAKSKGFQFFGLQDSNAYGNRASQAWATNDVTGFNQYGPTSCNTISDANHKNYKSGGPWANAVYKV